jgi:putative tricarboxylic transport membrane protein
VDSFFGLMHGFKIALTLSNLFACFVGVLIGTLVGVLPGIGPTGAMALLLPVTFGMSPVSSIIMLAGIYYGAMYGGSTTSILVNIPGETSSVVTCLDGYQMARQGRAGPALGISAFGSFIAGTFGVILLVFFVLPLCKIALKFGPPEYFGLLLASLTLLTYLVRGSVFKAIVMAVIGLILSTIGLDMIEGTPRLTFGSEFLEDGIGLVPLAMGLFGISEILSNLERGMDRSIFKAKIRNLLPNREDWKRSAGPISRGSVLGFCLGVIPGGGGVLSSFISYALEKKLSKRPEGFGRGAIEGVAGPESANNSGATGAFVPLFALGIPTNVVTALLLGGFMIHGLTPGPLLISKSPDVFWGVIASMYIGNGMLLVLNLPLISIWVKILKVPYRILVPLILFFCLIGSYSLNNNVLDVIVMIISGIVGYIMRKFDYEPAPLLLAFILGPMIETNLRQSLIMSGGTFSIFLGRPISAAALAVMVLLLISTGFTYYQKAKSRIAE